MVIQVSVQVTYRHTDGTSLGTRAFIANNSIVIPVLVSSPDLLMRFTYTFRNDNAQDVRVRMAHILVFDPSYRESLVVKGLVLDPGSPDYTTPTNIRWRWGEGGGSGDGGSKGEVVVQPTVHEIRANQTSSTDSTLSFSLDGRLRKDATGVIIVDEWIVDRAQNIERLVKRYIFEHQIMITDKITNIGDTGIGAGALNATHIITLEGSPIGDITQVLQRLTSLFGQSTVIASLVRSMDAGEIIQVVNIPVTTADGKRRVKSVFVVREGSPIAPIGLIIVAVAGLAAIAGIIYAIGHVMQIRKEEKELEAQVRLAETRTQIMERTVGDATSLARNITENPNLTLQEKQALLDALSSYMSALTTDVERSTSLLPSYLGRMDFLQLLLFTGIGLVGAGMFTYIIGEVLKTRRTEALLRYSSTRGRRAEMEMV